jgi:hypothetical protein
VTVVAAITESLSVAELDAALSEATFVENPYPVYQALRSSRPVHWC